MTYCYMTDRKNSRTGVAAPSRAPRSVRAQFAGVWTVWSGITLLVLCLMTAACGFDPAAAMGNAPLPKVTSSHRQSVTNTAAPSGSTTTATTAPSGGALMTTNSVVSPVSLVAAVAPSAGSLSYCSVLVGSSVSKQISLINTGPSSVTVFSASIAGPGFSASQTAFPWTLAPGASRAMTVIFAPDTSGTATGTLSFVSNATSSTTSVALSGTGVTPLPHSVTLTWQPGTSAMGHNVYRSQNNSGPYARVNTSIAASDAFVDAAVQSGNTYYYVVTSVDSDGRESAYSSQVAAAVPTP